MFLPNPDIDWSPRSLTECCGALKTRGMERNRFKEGQPDIGNKLYNMYFR